MAGTHSPTKLGKIYQKTKGHCAYCGVQLAPYGDWHVEHITPKSKGGTNRIENLVASCNTCNGKKQQKTIAEYRVWLRQSATEKLDWIEQHLSWLRKKNHVDEARIDEAIEGVKRLRNIIHGLNLKFHIDKFDI